jgi:zinc protease
LVVERGLAVNAGGWYQSAALDETRFGVFASPKPGVTLQQLDEAVDAVITSVAENGVSAAEAERARTRLIADSVFAQDNQSSLARWYGTALTTGSTVEMVKSWPDRIRAVPADAVKEAARKWLDKRRSVTGFLIKDMPVANDNKREEKRS